MTDRKTVRTGFVRGSYGRDEVRVEEMRRGRFAGRFVTRGAGFAGRVAYQSFERACGAVEAHAHFDRWEA